MVHHLQAISYLYANDYVLTEHNHATHTIGTARKWTKRKKNSWPNAANKLFSEAYFNGSKSANYTQAINWRTKKVPRFDGCMRCAHSLARTLNIYYWIALALNSDTKFERKKITVFIALANKNAETIKFFNNWRWAGAQKITSRVVHQRNFRCADTSAGVIIKCVCLFRALIMGTDADKTTRKKIHENMWRFRW